jgi:hypothetical protein
MTVFVFRYVQAGITMCWLPVVRSVERLLRSLAVYVGWLAAVACAAWRALPLLSRHSLTVDPLSVTVVASAPSSQTARLASCVGDEMPEALGRNRRGDMGMVGALL